MRELGIEKKNRFWESWARNYPVGEVASPVWHTVAMLFSALRAEKALPWCPASPCSAALQRTPWWLQSMGLQGKRWCFCCRNPILCSERFFFLRKRLTRLNKENRRCGRALPGAALGWGSAEVVADAGRAWASRPDLLCLSFPILKSNPPGVIPVHACSCQAGTSLFMAFRTSQLSCSSNRCQAPGSRGKGRI